MVKKNSKYEKLVNFKSNLELSRHSWFNIKEGYSKDLVTNVISDLGIDKNDGLIMDPFSGSGTSVLSCSEMGYKSIGIEVNPFLHSLSVTKRVVTVAPMSGSSISNFRSSHVGYQGCLPMPSGSLHMKIRFSGHFVQR